LNPLTDVTDNVKKIDLLLVSAFLVATPLLSSTASAMMFGTVDQENNYPYVGLVLFYDENLVPLWRYSGALISERVFLTAGHCTGYDPELGLSPARAQVWFDVGPIPRDPSWQPGMSCLGEFTGYPCAGEYWGTPHAHPGWTGHLTIPNTHDVGVVVLDEPVSMPEYGKLAPMNYLDDLAVRRGLKNVKFTVVGYGLQMVRPYILAERTRYVAEVMLVDLRGALNDGCNIQITSIPGQGTGPGGVCFGDSRGPVIHKGPYGGVIVAVDSFVLYQNCMGTAFAFRVDTAEAWKLLEQYILLYGRLLCNVTSYSNLFLVLVCDTYFL
jgi:hypothetical protein